MGEQELTDYGALELYTEKLQDYKYTKNRKIEKLFSIFPKAAAGAGVKQGKGLSEIPRAVVPGMSRAHRVVWNPAWHHEMGTFPSSC